MLLSFNKQIHICYCLMFNNILFIFHKIIIYFIYFICRLMQCNRPNLTPLPYTTLNFLQKIHFSILYLQNLGRI